jgi:cell division septal protein FtsQ
MESEQEEKQTKDNLQEQEQEMTSSVGSVVESVVGFVELLLPVFVIYVGLLLWVQVVLDTEE